MVLFWRNVLGRIKTPDWRCVLYCVFRRHRPHTVRLLVEVVRCEMHTHMMYFLWLMSTGIGCQDIGEQIAVDVTSDRIMIRSQL